MAPTHYVCLPTHREQLPCPAYSSASSSVKTGGFSNAFFTGHAPAFRNKPGKWSRGKLAGTLSFIRTSVSTCWALNIDSSSTAMPSCGNFHFLQ